MVGNDPAYRPHGGLGLEYKLDRCWSVQAEWTADVLHVAGVTYRNNNVAVGVNLNLEGEHQCVMPAPAHPRAVEANPPERVAESAAAGGKASEQTAPVKAPARSVNRVFF
jgi:hypothetical protein